MFLQGERLMTVPRTDPLTPIHKALRKRLFELGVQVGRTDLGNPAAVAAVEPDFDRATALLNVHGAFEDDYLLPLARKYGLTGCEQLEEEHRHHDQELKALIEQFKAHRQGKVVQDAVGRNLYQALSHFIASYLLHLDEEETKLLPQVYEKVPNAEVAAELQRFRATRPPEAAKGDLISILVAQSPSERAGMLRGFRSALPPPAFEGLRKVAAEALSADEFAKLEAALAT
jgi:hemerythrin